MRILLTGPTGYLGSTLAHYWVNQGHELCLLARSSSKINRIQSLLSHVRLERLSTTTDSIRIMSDFRPDSVVHTACAYGRSGESPLTVLDANLRLGVALLQAAMAREGEHTVFINTGTALTPDVNLYALSKNQFSQWGATLASQQPKRLQFIDIQLQQMYGPGDDRSNFTTHVIEACRLGEDRLALTLGKQRRDFIYIDDVVTAYDTILNHRSDLGISDAIELGTGTTVSIREFVELVHGLTAATTMLDFGAVPYRPHEPMLCVANTARLSAMGWTPFIDLESGITRILEAHPNSTSIPLETNKK